MSLPNNHQRPCINRSHAVLVWGNINMYSNSLSYSNTAMTQKVDTVPCRKKKKFNLHRQYHDRCWCDLHIFFLEYPGLSTWSLEGTENMGTLTLRCDATRCENVSRHQLGSYGSQHAIHLCPPSAFVTQKHCWVLYPFWGCLYSLFDLFPVCNEEASTERGHKLLTRGVSHNAQLASFAFVWSCQTVLGGPHTAQCFSYVSPRIHCWSLWAYRCRHHR